MDSENQPVFAQQRVKRINRKTKRQVIFDEKARRDFLTGFHKRKLQRKKKAKEELKEQLKEERKRLKQEVKEQYKKMVKTYQPIPELEERLAQHYEVENATVSILELDTDLLADENFIIGRNRMTFEEDPVKKEEPSSCEQGEGDRQKSLKEIKHEVKKIATKNVKKSSVFKRLNRIEQVRQRKKSSHLKDLKRKAIEKKNRKKNKRPTPRNS